MSASESLPLCFVASPFGRKPDAGGEIDFDAVYAELLQPAIRDAGLEPLRADEEQAGGIIHKPMFERLVLCEYAVADLTTANANVFYELGVRHAVKPFSTVLTFAKGRGQLPFDTALLRGLPYSLGADGRPSDAARDRAALAERLQSARDRAVDSPVFQLLDAFPDIARLKTDVFRERVRYSDDVKRRLADARRTKQLDAIKAVDASLGPIEDVEAAVLVDLFLSYRAVKGWDEMIALARRLPAPLAGTVMIREQLALALNRAGRGDEAEALLQDLLASRGPSSETYGILGRVYKDRWEAAVKAGDRYSGPALFARAIDAYLKGFEADMRDAYPGINAVTLMELADPPDPRRLELLPVVRYAVERRVAQGKPDYWDFATRLELAVLAGDEPRAAAHLGEALASQREPFEAETTARNLRLIREARERRGQPADWIAGLEQALAARGGRP